MDRSTTIKTRSYSIGNEEDGYNTNNGRCPTYALSWSPEANDDYWPQGHDYFIGNNTPIHDGTQVIRQILSKRLADKTLRQPLVFCDLDGVLADFDQGVINRFKKRPDELKPGLMWGVINKSNSFFETLPWMPRGREFWDKIKHLNPIILTGIPNGKHTAAEQKIRWCQRELSPDIQVITCATKDKSNYCIPGAILIDDRPNNMKAWEAKEGHFILYDEENQDSIIYLLKKVEPK